MTEEIKLSKFDNEPWGFRLTGGKDFGTVLTIIKINQGSLAESAGMRVGDLLLAINDQPLTNLTHSEAHDVIVHAGNNFVLTIVRGSLVLPPFMKKDTASTASECTQDKQSCINEKSFENEPDHKDMGLEKQKFGDIEEMSKEEDLTLGQELENIVYTNSEQEKKLPSPIPVIEVTTPKINASQDSANNDGERKPNNDACPISEEELEDMMLGHAEVIGGKAIGVDFYKLAPKCEVIGQSEVLQAIHEEKVNEAKKTISKFLQLPNRPKVKPKQSDLPETVPYKPLIIIPRKGQPKGEEQNKQDQESSQEPSGEEKQDPETIQGEKQDLQTIEEDQKDPVDQGEETKEQEQNGQENQQNHTEEGEQLTQNQVNHDYQEDEEDDEILKEMAAINAKLTGLKKEMQDEQNNQSLSPEFEQQFKKINEQLVNLLCMPLDMQRYLVQVKKQLDELRRLKNPPPPEPEPEVEPELEPDSQKEPSEKGKTPTPTATPAVTPQPDSEGLSGNISPQSDLGEQGEAINVGAEKDTDEAKPPLPEPEIGPPKHPRRDIQWQKEPPPKNRPFYPLTPKPRPVVLPQDTSRFHDDEMFSEEFIAETLSGSAEVIEGRALGVNFMKFKRNYDHLKTSDVYRMIHNEDKESTVFPSRSGKTPSKEECLQSASVKTE